MESQKKSKNRVLTWLDEAKWSASGGNAQPWRVQYEELEDGKICIHLSIDWNYRYQRWSPMDVEGSASAMALGALAFNIEVVAAQDDFALHKTCFKEEKDFWRSELLLIFTKSEKMRPHFSSQDLYARRTNRFKYSQQSISGALKEAIMKISERYQAEVDVVDASVFKNEAIKKLVHLERLRWKEPFFLNSLLREISFDKNEEYGIPIDQLGVSLADQKLLKLNCKFPLLRHSFHLGGQYMSSIQNLVNPIKHSGGIFFLQARAKSFKACCRLGFVFQEIWTETNKQEYAFQPISIPFIAQGLEKKARLRPEHLFAISEAESFFKNKLTFDIHLPMIGFRVGKSAIQVGKSSRRDIAAFPAKNLLAKFS
ncbi:MAG: hypothetical protein H6625_08505 [Bdellovibrionaceae bacterium]|nr:hypothetical protein [Pseudobdellovibrionaceae bacterium]